MKTTRLDFSRLPATFDGLVKFHPPRPIHDSTGYDNTVEIVDALAGHALNRDQEDYLVLLSTLIERYDADHVEKLPASSGLDLLKYLLEQHDLSGDALAKILHVDRSIAYRILNSERHLTAAHVKTLGEHFCVPADIFL